MGGIIFVVPSVILSAFFTGLDMTALVACGLTLFYAAVGFADDFIKIRFNKNEGLTPLQKIVFQLLGALLAAAFAVRTEKTLVFIPFTDVFFDFGFWYFPFVAFVFLSLTNCVNLTDGLDGLAASSSVPVLFCVSALAFLNGGEQGLSLFAFIFAFSLVAFLFFPQRFSWGIAARSRRARRFPVSLAFRATLSIPLFRAYASSSRG